MLIYCGVVIICLIQALDGYILRHSMKLQNNEQIIISTGDVENDNNRLEMIRLKKETPDLEKRLKKFHNRIQNTQTLKDFWNFEMLKPFKASLNSIVSQDIELNPKNRLKHVNYNGNEAYEGNKDYDLPEAVKGKIIQNATTEISNNDLLKKEYEEKIENETKNNLTFRYSDEGKPEESVKEAIKKIVDVKTPKNCTNVKGFGLKSVECLYKDMKKEEIDEKDILVKISKILLIWFVIYSVITIPLWCIKGWCCCCFRCEFCQPNKTIKNIQKYIADNPPGIFINPEGEEEHYLPSAKESKIYEELNKAILFF